jgi:hypothetical protein
MRNDAGCILDRAAYGTEGIYRGELAHVRRLLRAITAESANFVLIDIFVFWFACVMLASTPGASAMSCTKCQTVLAAILAVPGHYVTHNYRVVVTLRLSVTVGFKWHAPHAPAMAVLGRLGGRPSIQEAEVVQARCRIGML